LAAFLLAPVVALVDQTGVPDGQSSRTRSPWAATVSRDAARLETGLGYLDRRSDNDVVVLDAMLLKVVSLLKAILLVCVRILLVLLHVLFVILNK
jgi:hypothetical protein